MWFSSVSNTALLLVIAFSVPKSAPNDVQCTPLTSQSIRITWKELSPEASNGVLQGYKVVYGIEGKYYTNYKL